MGIGINIEWWWHTLNGTLNALTKKNYDIDLFTLGPVTNIFFFNFHLFFH